MIKLLSLLGLLAFTANANAARNIPADTVQFSTQTSAPGSAASGSVYKYFLTSDGLPYWKNSSGTVFGYLYSSAVYTAGSVLFGDGTRAPAQDNSGIFFDSTNNFLGIGSASPPAQLYLSGAISAAAWTTSGIGLRIADQTFTDTTSTGSPNITIHNIGAPTVNASSALTPGNLTTLVVAAPVDGTNVVTASNRKYAIRTTGNTRFAGFNLYGSSSGNPVSVLSVDGNQTDTSWTTTGKMLAVQNATLTDSSGTGTISTRAVNSYGVMTLAASNSQTITNASNLYLDRAVTAGSNVAITNSNVIHIPGGSVTGATNSYSLNVTANTGATNNYAATFSGNVGMGGITDPRTQLSIAASASVINGNEQISLRSNREAIIANELLGGISIRSNDSSNAAPGIVTNLFSAIATAGHNTTTLDSAWVWYTTNALTMAEKMRLDKDGYLGIGVTPTSKLHVDGGTGTAAAIKLSNGATNGTTASDGFDVGVTSTGIGELRQREALPINILTNNTQVMSIVSAGNVGIGNTSPTTKLDVTGTVTATAFAGTINAGRTINAQTGTSYTFVMSDGASASGSATGFPLVTGSNASAQTFTVPPNTSVNYPTGTQIDVCQLGAGKLTLAQGSGVTINSKAGNKAIGAQYVCVTLIKYAIDTWNLIGDLIP